MDRVTVYLDAILKRRLAEAARSRGVAEAVVLREALEQYLQEPQAALEPVGRSTDGGVAHRVDEALDEPGFGDADPL